MGYRFLAQSESSQTHDIPIGFDLGDPDYRQIMRAIEEFVEIAKSHQQPPLLFAKVQHCAAWITDLCQNIHWNFTYHYSRTLETTTE